MTRTTLFSGWRVPPEGDAAFVAAMERVLEVHARPYDPRSPVVCTDGRPKQLVRESRETVPAALGRPERVDCEHARESPCCVWTFAEPLGGWRSAEASPRRTALLGSPGPGARGRSPATPRPSG